MKICRIVIDLANNMSAIGTKWYNVVMDENSKETSRRYIPGSTRLWIDRNEHGLNSALIPSVILYQKENAGTLERDYFGWEAMELLKNPSIVVKPRKDIKYRYFIERNKFGENAKDFKRMLEYLMDCIFFVTEEEPDAYEISISYPVICQDVDIGSLEELIGDIWFEKGKTQKLLNLELIDEAECALRFALKDKPIAEQLGKQLSEKQEQLVLVVDIGGSTMELCLYTFRAHDGQGKYKRLQILRANDDAGRGMGSLKVDKLLRNKLNNVGALDMVKLKEINSDLLMLRYFTPLKEEINKNLKNNRVAKLISLYPICDIKWMQQSQNINVTKAKFTEWCRGYTAEICEQIKLLCQNAGRTHQDINMVILTGGGCELYPVEDAIRALLKNNTLVLRPTDPTDVLDYAIQDKDHEDYINGLCPRDELASLACVLGNLAGASDIPVPKLLAMSKPIAVATKGMIDGYGRWELRNDGTLVLDGKGKLPDWDRRPNSLETTSPWNVFCKKIVAAEIRKGSTYIGGNTFHECEKLTSIHIPEGVTQIGKNAFGLCFGLKEVYIPDGVTEICDSAFFCCRLNAVIIPDSVFKIGKSAFSGCRMKSISIPVGVTEISDWVFADCYDLNAVNIPNSVTRIGDRSFESCKALRVIDLPSSILEIDREAFYQCENLEIINIQNGVTKIGVRAFYGCKSLKSIRIPCSVTEIASEVFEGCDNCQVYMPRKFKPGLFHDPYFMGFDLHFGIKKVG